MLNRRKSVIGLMTAAVLLIALNACDLGDVLSAKSGSIKEGRVTTVAGPFTDGSGGTSEPRGVAVDYQGTVYVTNHHAGEVLKITFGSNGVVSGQTTLLSGLDYPQDICYGMDGFLYVVEPYDKKITKIDPVSGASTLFYGWTDVKVLSGILGIAADRFGNVYAAEGSNNRIRKIEPDGTVTTFAGGKSGFANGEGSDAKFQYPSGIAVDRAGNVYVSDAYNHCIRKITPEAVVSVYASYAGSWGFVDSDSGSSKFGVIHGMAINVDTGDLFVFDRSSGGVRKITPGREVLPPDPPNTNPLVPETKTPIVVGRSVVTIAGDRKWDSKERSLIDGPAFSARFGNVAANGDLGYPKALAADTFGNVYVADSENLVLRRIAP
ncbi:hypothetical protein FACS1894147_11170 [Spirochaetia bacterium]|nr:hypothetical protein FACS1894147_11170 [Spirochaetia bacterium]